jgi:hypothetical protein
MLYHNGTAEASAGLDSVGKDSVNTANAVIAALQNGPAVVVPLVREVPSDILKRRPSPGKWSAHEHACHLASVHPIFVERLRLILSEASPYIRSYMPDASEEAGALLRVDLAEALTLYERERRELLEMLRALQPRDWQRTAKHEEYSHYSVLIMFRHLALHDMLHAYRIEELLLRKDWGSHADF